MRALSRTKENFTIDNVSQVVTLIKLFFDDDLKIEAGVFLYHEQDGYDEAINVLRFEEDRKTFRAKLGL